MSGTPISTTTTSTEVPYGAVPDDTESPIGVWEAILEVSSAIRLRASYAIPSTDLPYGAIGLRELGMRCPGMISDISHIREACYPALGSALELMQYCDVQYKATGFFRYAIRGTEIGGLKRFPDKVSNPAIFLCAYVLTQRSGFCGTNGAGLLQLERTPPCASSQPSVARSSVESCQVTCPLCYAPAMRCPVLTTRSRGVSASRLRHVRY
eukprot:1301341-Rhodomonas_salina.3